MDPFNAYLIGVGGQGIGMLSEILIRAADYAGHKAKAVDTHGLAQRGGTVISHLRLGHGVHAPLVPDGEAHLVVALERNEAFRGLGTAARDGGILVYYDTVWQPLGVRLGQDAALDEKQVERTCRKRNIHCHRVYDPDLEDPRMQNIAVLAEIGCLGLIPGVVHAHYRAAMQDLLGGSLLEKNMALYNARCATAAI
jgi:indolepyruvate ferredoxin oxidoreductase beta subunit